MVKHYVSLLPNLKQKKWVLKNQQLQKTKLLQCI